MSVLFHLKARWRKRRETRALNDGVEAVQLERRRLAPAALGFAGAFLASGVAQADVAGLSSPPVGVPGGAAGLDALGALSGQLVKTTGSVALRTLQDRFGEVVNVKDFGATGKGTNDDTAAIQAANTAAAGLGLPIFFPPGTYSVTGLTGITQPIYGWSRYSTKIVLATTAGGHLLKLADSVVGWSMREVTLDSQSVGGHGITSNLATNIDIRRCQILNSGLCGIYITSATNAFVEDCLVNNSGSAPGAAAAASGAGISIYASNGAVRKNTVTNSGGANITGGTYIPTGSVDGYIDIDDNYCYNAGTIVTQDNITLYDSTNVRIRVRDNRCYKSANHNIHVGGSDVEIKGNQCYNAGQSNILCSSRIAGTQTLAPFVGGTVTDNTCDTAGLNNIQLDGVSQVTVNANKCRNSAGNGIVSLLSSTDLEITGNTIKSPAVAGISVGGMIDGVVALNTITSPSTSCIQIQPSGDATPVSMSNTVVIGNTGRGGTYLLNSTDGGATYVVMNIGTGQGSTTSTINVPNATIVLGNMAGAASQSLVWGGAVGSTGAYGTAFGLQATTKARYGFHAIASGLISAASDAQGGRTVLRGSTGAGTTCSLTADGTSRGTHNIVNLVSNSTISIAGNVILRDGSGNTATFAIDATMKNTGGTASLVGTPVVTARAADSAASSWTVGVAADTTNLGFNIVVTAVAGVYADAHLTVTELVH